MWLVTEGTKENKENKTSQIQKYTSVDRKKKVIRDSKKGQVFFDYYIYLFC